MLKVLIMAVGLFGPSYAFADEVVVHPGAVAPPVVVGHERDRDADRDRVGGCDSTTIHKEADNGDSKTVKKTNCN